MAHGPPWPIHGALLAAGVAAPAACAAFCHACSRTWPIWHACVQPPPSSPKPAPCARRSTIWPTAVATGLLCHVRPALVSRAVRMLLTLDEAEDPVSAISAALQVRPPSGPLAARPAWATGVMLPPRLLRGAPIGALRPHHCPCRHADARNARGAPRAPRTPLAAPPAQTPAPLTGAPPPSPRARRAARASCSAPPTCPWACASRCSTPAAAARP